jgi:hypothetical protein
MWVVVLAAALAACAQRPAPPPPPATLALPALIDPAAACLKDLAEAQVLFERVEGWGAGTPCAVETAVKVSQAAIPWSRPGVLSCQMARTVLRFETQVVQPLAQRHLGKSIRRIHHAGTYDCRTERGRSRLSQHSKGNAFDIFGFETSDGAVINVERHWGAKDARSAFLHGVSAASCELFNVVLTPNRDRDHKDHLHLDIGPYRLCGY